MGTTAIALYNGALRLIKERRLSTISDAVPSRYLLDDVYAGAKAYVLEQGQWAFASRSTSIAGSASSNRGYSYRFTKPTDFVRLISISGSSTYYPPLEAYAEDGTYWFSNQTTIYITYVSNDASYGGDLTKWPETYSRAVEAFMAVEIAPHLTNQPQLIAFAQESYESALKIALAKDCINRTSRIVSAGTLSIYNGALRLLKKRLITNFDDRTIARRIYDASGEKGAPNQPGRPPTLPASDVEDEMVLRRLLDEAYDDAVEHCLADSLWNFASRTVAIEAETDIEPEFGYNYTFEKPDDFIRLVAIADNGFLYPTLDEYLDEGQYWHANVDPLYVQYVSDDTSAGRDESLWPITFKKAVEAYLALEIAPSAGMSANFIAGLNDEFRRRLRDARSKDSANQAAMRPSPGRLLLARTGGTFRSMQRREN